MLYQLNLLDLLSAISSPESASGPTPCAEQDGPMIVLYGQDHVRASLSARQAKEQDLLMSGTCGQPFTTSSASASLQSCLVSKLQAKTALVGSTLYCLTWKQRDTPGGAVDLCAAGVGAPHIRQRLWWVGERLGNSNNTRCEGDVLHPLWIGRDRSGPDGSAARPSTTGNVANAGITRLQGREWGGPTGTQGSSSGYSSECSGLGGLANTDSDGRSAWDRIRSNGQEHDAEYGGGKVGVADSTSIGRVEGVTHDGRLRGGNSAEGPSDRSTINGDLGCGLADTSGIGRGAGGVWDNSGNDGNQPDADVKDGISMADTAGAGQHQRGLRNGREFQQGTREASGERGPQTDCSVGPDENVDMAQRNFPSGPTNGHWRDADWLFCRDGKWRPVEPGTSPLAHGSAARVGRLRGYGNAIVAQAAQAFIESVM